MKKRSKIAIISSTATLILFSGCGGGGSSSNSLFGGDAKPAAVTVDTGKKVTENVLANRKSNNISAITMLSNDSENGGFVAKGLEHFLKNQKNIRSLSTESSESVDETEKCDNNGGTVHYVGSGNDMSGGVVAVEFHNCSMDGFTFNGPINMDIKLSNEEPVRYKISFPQNFEMKNTQQSVLIYKNSSILMDNMNGYDNFDMTNNIKMKMNDTLTGSENSKWHVKDSSTYQISGKEYLGSLDEFVKYDTSYDMSQTPFIFNYDGTIQSGEAHYIGADNGKIVIKAENGGITIKTDSDNDGVFESTETVAQSEILF